MTRREYRIVDVFTDRPLAGNPLAVFADGTGIDASTMQAIAKELHLSETTFVVPSGAKGADWKVRIFTPDAELPFAGHPSLGTAFVLADGKDTQLGLEEGVGVIRVAVTQGFAQMEQPLPTFSGTTISRKTAADALGLAVEEVRSDVPIQAGSSGLEFLYVPLANLKAVKRAQRPSNGLPGNVYAFAMSGERGGQVHGRMFAEGIGVAEDPGTGAAQGPLGAYCVVHGLVNAASTVRIRSEQGFEIGRPSILDIEIDWRDDTVTGVRVGGRCVAIGGGWLDV